ncbi:hypothetical protein Cni_G28121 [Canna indica]|uniref:RRM domain-containing protein n=1 Tax=Canna indica TaxID=4628 RepID=A0AAQ3L221_9LILI|nr:hypothetical protein Cni_G28121 [Canna indica]
MPPRVAKRAVAKKSSPRTKKPPTPAAEAPPPASIDEVPSEEAAAVKEEESHDAVFAAPMEVEASLEEGNPPASEVPKELVVEEKAEELVVQHMAMQETESEEKVEETAVVQEVEREAAAEVIDGGESASVQVDDSVVLPQESEEADADVNDGGETASLKVDDSVVLPQESEEAPKDPGDSVEVRETGEDDEMNADLGKKHEIEVGTEVDDEEEDETEDIENINEGDTHKSDDNADNEENDEDDASLYIQTQMTDRNKHKKFGIFVGGLDKAAVEEDLTKVFGVFGELQSVRIVKNPVTLKSKGFAFIHYVNIDDAKKALAELKDGTEVRGKRVGISASQDNDTLYLGNICKTWTKEQVIETLKGYGINQFEDIVLPDDPKVEGKTKGFAFLEFNTHSDAMKAFQRLRKPDAVFGRDRSAKVGFAETSMQASEEVMLQVVKTVYVESFPDFWDENKIKENFQEYGEIEKVQLFRKSTTKKKDFAFVEFTSRESAVACVEGINRAQIGEGDVKVKVNLARRPSKGRLAKRAARGGFKINEDGDATKQVTQSKNKKKSKEVIVQRNAKSIPKKDESTSKSQGRGSKHKQHHVSAKSDKAKKRGGGDRGIVVGEQSSKKARRNYHSGTSHGRPSSIFDRRMDAYLETPTSSYVAQTASHYPRYALPATNYQGYTYPGASGSKPYRSDLEPHAGYLPASQHRQYPYGYEQRLSAYNIQPSRGSESTGAVTVPPTSFRGYSSSTGYQAGYTYPSSGVYPGHNTYAPRNYY